MAKPRDKNAETERRRKGDIVPGDLEAMAVWEVQDDRGEADRKRRVEMEAGMAERAHPKRETVAAPVVGIFAWTKPERVRTQVEMETRTNRCLFVFAETKIAVE